MKFNKKLLSFLLVFVLLFTSVMPCLSASAEGTGLNFKGGTDSVFAGDTAEISIDLERNPGVAGINLYYTFDTTYLTLTEVVNQNSHFNLTYNTTSVWDASSSYTDDGTLATLKFKVADNTPAGTYNVKINVLSVYNDVPARVTATSTDAVITVRDVELERIKITTEPARKEYSVGDTLSLTGMVVTGYYNNGTSAVLKDYDIVNNTLVRGENVITVKVGELTDTFSVMCYPTAPGVPTGLATTDIGTDYVNLTWNKVSGADGYRVTDINTGETYLVSENNISFNKIVTAKIRKYKVEAYTLEGEKYFYSGESDVLTVKLLPGRWGVSNVLPVDGKNELEVSWFMDEDVDGFIVTEKGSGKSVDVGNKSNYTFTDLEYGTEYSFTVTAYVNNDCGICYGEEGSPLSAKTVPAVTEGVTVTYKDSTPVSLNWNPVSGADGYLVTCEEAKISEYVSKTEFALTGLDAACEYTFKVAAYVDNRNLINFGTASDTVKVFTAPVGVENLKAEVKGDASVLLTWNKVEGAEIYRIYGSDIYVTTSECEYLFKGLTSATEYSFQVQAGRYDDNKDILYGPMSAEISVKTAPAQVEGLEVESTTASSVTLKWGAVTGAAGYQVVLNGKSYYTAKTALIIEDLDSITEYTAKVNAYVLNGDKKVFGEYSQEVTTLTNPDSVKNTAYKFEGDAVVLSWDAVKGAATYRIYSKEFGYIDTSSTTYTLNGLEVGKSYNFSICAGAVVGDETLYGEYADFPVVITAPEKISGLKVTSATTNSVTISWNVSAGAEGYRVLNLTTGEYDFVTENTYTFSGLTAATEYQFLVRAYLKNGADNIYGEGNDGFTAKTVPAKMTQPTVAVNGNTLNISWNALHGADGYLVYVKQGATAVYYETVNGTSFSAEKLAFGKEHQILVRAFVLNGKEEYYGAWSSSVYLKTAPEKAEGQMTNVTSSSVSLSWEAVNGAVGYRLLNTTTGVAKYVSGTSYNFTGLAAGKEYTFTLRAYLKNGTLTVYGETSDEITAKTTPAKMTQPTVAVNGNTLNISWDALQGADGYLVYVKQGATAVYYETVNGTSFSAEKLAFGKEHQILIRAFVLNGEKEYHGAWSSSVYIKTAPAKAGTVGVSSRGDTSLALAWDAVEGADGYRLLNVTTGAAKYVSGTSYTFTGLTANTEYEFYIRAYVKNGTLTVYGESGETVATRTNPAKPAAPAATADGTDTLNLTWDAIDGVDGYRLYVKQGATVVLLENTADTAYTLTDLEAGKTYTVLMRTFKEFGSEILYSGWSNTLTVKTAPDKAEKPTVTGAGTTSITLKWAAVEGAVGYRVLNSVTGQAKYVSGTTVSFTGLTAATQYNFYVRAYVKNGTSAVYGENSDVLITATRPATATLTLTAGTKKFTARWTKIAGASGYQVEYALNSSFTSGRKSYYTTNTSTVPGAATGKTYYVRIRAYKTVDGQKVFASWSAVKTVKVK